MLPRRPESWLIASNHLQERSPASACTRRLVTLVSGCVITRVCVCLWIRSCESANSRERNEALQPRGRKWGEASGCRRAFSVSFSFCSVSFCLSTKDEGCIHKVVSFGVFWNLVFFFFFFEFIVSRILECYYCVNIFESVFFFFLNLGLIFGRDLRGVLFERIFRILIECE